MRVTGLAVAAVVAVVGIAGASAEFKTQGVTDLEIVIGTHMDHSGPIKSWGVPATNGMKLAVKEINAAGGINGRTLRLVVEDDGYDPKKAVLATQKLIEHDHVFAIVSAMGSATTLAPLSIVQDAGMLHLFPITAAEFTFKMDPAKPEDRLKFNIFSPYYDTMRTVIKWTVDNKHFKTPCMIYQDDEMGKNFTEAFKDEVQALGLSPGVMTSFKRGATDFSAQVAKAKAGACDLVALGSVVRESVGIVTTARKLGWDVAYACSTPTYVPDFPDLAKENAEGVYCAGAGEIFYPDTATGRVKAYIEDYTKEFGVAPNIQTTAGYDGAQAFAHYARLAGRNLTTDSLLAALESGDAFQDIFGGPVIKFSKTDHLGVSGALIAQVQNGRWVTLAREQHYQ